MASTALPVYVTVGGTGRFGENRSGKRAQGVVVAIGAAMALCLLIGAAMEERNMVPAALAQAGTTALSQQALRQLEGKLSSKEVNYEVARQAVQALPVHQQVLAVKFAAEALSSTPTTTDLQECSNKESYEAIQESFTELAANISASNSSLYAREATLKAAADEAHSAWLDSQSQFRTATAEKESAKQAATYAAGMYTKFETAVSAGQAQYDTEKPKLDEEMAQLNEELPVLQEVLALVESLTGGAAAKGNAKAILKLAQSKVLALVPPAGDSKMDASIKQLKTSLQETATAGTAASMSQVIQNLQAEISARITEIQTQITAMETQLADDEASKADWEQKMVALSDEHDKAQNDEASADLVRRSEEHTSELQSP